MDDNELRFIQDRIGYNFENLDLLEQAFVRKSYSQENGGENNEVLEFIGDKVLDLAVVRYLTERYGYTADSCDDYVSGEDYNEFFCDLSEGELTDIKRRLVEKKMLAHRIDVLDLADFLIMGKGDVQNSISQENSVKEDLFEAILGAVAVDSSWNFDELQSTVEIMLDPETELADNEEENYVGLVHDWVSGTEFKIPWYRFEKGSYSSTWYFPFNGISQSVPLGGDYHDLQYRCILKIGDKIPVFRGFGKSKSEARKAVCKMAYEYLIEHDLVNTIRDEIENPNKADAINQLEILSRRGYFSIPTYSFNEEHDGDGNPIWTCECRIEEYDNTFSAVSSSKRDAKKTAAFDMLRYVLS